MSSYLQKLAAKYRNIPQRRGKSPTQPQPQPTPRPTGIDPRAGAGQTIIDRKYAPSPPARPTSDGDSSGGGGGGPVSGTQEDIGPADSPFTDVSPAGPAMGGSDLYPGILAGGEITRIERSGADDLWVALYEFPAGSGKYVAWQFDNVEQLEGALGPEWHTRHAVSHRDEGFLQQQVNLLDNADEIIGVEGNFGRLMNDTMMEQARIAGVSDPGVIGMIANNTEWQEIAAQAALGNWTDAQTQGALRATDFWRNELYPGIDAFYGQTSEPEQAWREYSTRVEQSLEQLGYQRSGDGSYRGLVGEMLGNGVDDRAFVRNTEFFVRAENSAEYREALNVWTNEELGKTLQFEDWFDLLAGQAPAEVDRVVELANLQYAADRAGLQVGTAELAGLASNADLSEQQALAAFSEVESSLMAIGEDNLSRFGLSKNDLLSAATGTQSESGRSLEQIRLSARVAAREMGLVDDVRTQLFVGFSSRGTPERPGLRSFAPEGA